MIEIRAHPGSGLAIGRRGENEARRVAFDLSAWRRDYGEGTVQLLHQRAGDESPYPCTVTVEGDTAYWLIQAADVDKVGWGSVQLHYYVGATLAKSAIWRTVTADALGDPSETPPEPQQGWVDKMLADVVAATTAAQSDWAENDEKSASYIKNRTHWVETKTYELQHRSGNKYDDIPLDSIELVQNRLYEIVYDGKHYTLPYGLWNSSTWGIGNAYAVGAPQRYDNGIPFGIMLRSETIRVGFLEDGDHTLSVSWAVYRELPFAYLPSKMTAGEQESFRTTIAARQDYVQIETDNERGKWFVTDQGFEKLQSLAYGTPVRMKARGFDYFGYRYESLAGNACYVFWNNLGGYVCVDATDTSPHNIAEYNAYNSKPFYISATIDYGDMSISNLSASFQQVNDAIENNGLPILCLQNSNGISSLLPLVYVSAESFVFSSADPAFVGAGCCIDAIEVYWSSKEEHEVNVSFTSLPLVIHIQSTTVGNKIDFAPEIPYQNVNAVVTFPGCLCCCLIQLPDTQEGNVLPFSALNFETGDLLFEGISNGDYLKLIWHSDDSMEFTKAPLPKVEGTGLILESSTEGSNKRFFVSVDDTGTLSAKEITET